MAASATLFRRLPYDVPDSFAPLGLVSDAAMTIVTRPGFPATDLAGYMAALKRQGDLLNLAHRRPRRRRPFCALLVQQAAGAARPAWCSAAPRRPSPRLMAGRLDFLCDQATNTVPYIRDGRVQAWAGSSPQRLPGLELPTTAEAGFGLAPMSTWHGLYAPAGTPEPRSRRALPATTRRWARRICASASPSC